MGGNNLSVRITADVVDLQQKFATARAEASSLSSEMTKLAKASAAGTLDSAGQSAFAQIAQQYLQAKSAAAGYSAQIRENVEANRGFGGSIDEARSKLSTLFQVTGAAVAYEAVSKLVQIVTQLGERAIEIRSMSDVLQVTTGQFQAMSVAAEEAGVSDSILLRANEKLVATLLEARNHNGAAIESLQQLGITIEQIRDPTFDLNSVLAVIGGRLRNSATSAAEMAAATALLGGRAALAAEAWKQYEASAAGVAAADEKVGALNDTQLDRLKEMSTWWKELGTSAANAAAKLLVAATTDAEGVDNVRTRLLNAAHAAPQLEQLADVQVTAIRMVTAATLQGEQDQVEAASTGSAQRLALATQYYNDTRALYKDDSVSEVRAAYREMISAGKEFDEARRAGLQQQLQDAKEKDREDTASYRESLSSMKEAEKEFATIDRQNADADIAIARSTVEAKKSLLESEISASSQFNAQKLAALRALVNQEYALDIQERENELAGLEDEPAAYNRVYNEIRELKAKNVQDLAALDEQAAQASRRAAQQDSKGWQDSVREIESAESTLTSDLLSKRRSLGASLIQISANFLQQEIANDIKAMTTKLLLASTEANSEKALEQGGLLFHLLFSNQATQQTIAAQTAQTQATIAGNQMRTAATASGAASAKAAGAAANSSVVMADAAKAFSGTYASVAQIPYVGWLLAPAAGAAAFAAVAAYEGLASLDIGAYNIPQDMVAKVHAGESVLSKPEAQAWRQQVESGGAEQGGGDTHNHTWNVNTLDGKSLAAMIHSSQFQNEIGASMKRYFNRGGR